MLGEVAEDGEVGQTDLSGKPQSGGQVSASSR